MRLVTRTAKPGSLETNAAAWTKELMDLLQKGTAFDDIPKSLLNRYRKTDVQVSLRSMYQRKCCYCENLIGISDYEHIDHLKPKSLRQFHQLTFEWSNLHWSCQRCNQKKGNKWDDVNPILDPTVDDPEEHLEFDITTCKIRPKNGSLRGRTTIEHTNLNRESLVDARIKVRDKLRNIILRYKKAQSAEAKEMCEEDLLPYLQQSETISYTLLVRQILRQYGLL
ncbi:TIGR02646 family protein [Tumebacillus sp. ITR2]|uniref:TIGR02646 family protein n=1 Tax=Tumebacillus amylolyticus TaxID=2801339 RepID=A0ABS1J6D5_9BACL|nr:retron system putative HNH endonuclease [Tumebacillus amylolyticus]MBL0385842.1 TIGR02646 family protein [Tumebacillus amylolyticus]